MLVLSVAEKPSAAKRISELLANNGANRREGFSKYNKIFDYQVNIPQYGVCHMSMTSVSGHLKGIEFTENFKKWHSCNPRQLFQAQLRKQVGEGKEGIQKTLISEGRKAKMLIIWTDGDREGENIGFEIIDSVRSVNRNIILKRAKFSEITRPSILRALNNLVQPDENQSLAVDCRQELDLRIGAAFTRFQTLALQPMYPQLKASVISYGSCQFPTLGFVVDRWKANKNFQIEPFWKIELLHNQTTFNWFRQKLFCRDTVIAIQELCLASIPAKVTKMNNKPRSRWRPVAMDTILMEKLASQKLRINAQRTMAIAETLYNKGYLSYPRTETNIFPQSLELGPLVAMQRHTPEYADFVDRIVDEFQECPNPRNGNKNDQAHPPIHPTKPSDDSLNPEEKKLYNLIARHFLACVSRDAKGAGTSIEVTIGGEQFGAEGLMIQEKNYLEIYPFDNWSDKTVGLYTLNQEFIPESISVVSGQTQPPPLLSESDLITLMDKHGIGTDATHAEHIEKIKVRFYAECVNGRYFSPTMLGLSLVFGYCSMREVLLKNFSAPQMRSNLEKDLKKICDGTRTKEQVLADQITVYQRAFERADDDVVMLKNALRYYMEKGGRNPKYVPRGDDDFEDFDGRPPGGGPGGGPGSGPGGGNGGNDEDGKSGGGGNSVTNIDSAASSTTFPPDIGNLSTKIPGNYRKCSECLSPTVLAKFITGKYALLCTGCDSIIVMKSKAITNVTPSDQDCQKCSKSSRSFKKLKLFFKPGNSDFPPWLGLEYLSCVTPNCDSDMTGQFSLVRLGQNVTPVPRINQLAPGAASSSNRFGRGGNQVSGAPQVVRDETENGVNCGCDRPAKRFQVRKEGANKDRWFYTCDGKVCDFFEWEEEGHRPSAKQTGKKNYKNTSKNTNSRTNSGNWNNENNQNEWNRDQNDWAPNNQNKSSNKSSNNQNNQYNKNNQNLIGSCVPNCSCNKPSMELTVRKEGANKGRKFFKCGNGDCTFFEWADDTSNSTSNSTSHSTSNSTSTAVKRKINNTSKTTKTTGKNKKIIQQNPHATAKCNCEENNKVDLKTVTRESVNKGRKFYSCQNVGGCNYFEWEEDFKSKNSVVKSKQPRKAPTCGHCKLQGHTKRGCPQLKK